MLIEDMRRRIDEVDNEIVRLLNKRATIALDINRPKSACGCAYIDVQREREILRRVVKRNSGPMKDFRLVQIYEAIMKAGQ